jgi:hypothetical protein
VNIKLLPYTSNKTVEIAAVSPVAITPGNRALLPCPPGAVKVNGVLWPDGATYYGDVTLTWAHRNRHAQSGFQIVSQDAASVAAGPEGTYTVEVLVGDAVKQTQAGITGTSYTYTMAQREIDDVDLEKPVQFRITPVNGALSGRIRTTDPFIMQEG